MLKYKISQEDIELLKPYMDVYEYPTLDEFQNKLEDITILTFVDDEPTDESRILERIYDRVYMLN